MSKKRELARLMIEWGDAQEKADALAERIKEVVLAGGTTQVVGDVRASFVKPRRKHDYKKTFADSLLEYKDMPAKYLNTVTTTDWRQLCKDHKLEALFTVSGDASVRLKLEKIKDD